MLIGVVINEAIATGDDAGRSPVGRVLCVHFAVLSLAYRFGSRIGFRGLKVESHGCAPRCPPTCWRIVVHAPTGCRATC